MTDPYEDYEPPLSQTVRAFTAGTILGVIGWIAILLFAYEMLKLGGW